MVDPDDAVRTRAMDEAPIGMVITDPDRADNPIVYANDAYLDLTGYDREDVLGRNCRFLQGEATAEEPVARMREAVDAAEPVTVDIRNYRADGELFWNRVAISPVRDERGTVTHFVGTQRDVTEQKRRARQLSEIRDRMEFALDATDSYIYEIDIGTGEETRHGPFERLHGLPSAAVPTTEAFNDRAVHPDDRDQLAEVQRLVREEKPAEPVVIEYRTNPELGDVRWMRSEAYVQSGPTGEPDTFVGLATDVTAQQRHERELARQNERLDEFASVVSHDLQNPLNVAVGRLELARAEHDSEHLAALERSLDRMEALIEDLLTLARQGEPATDPQPVDLATLAGGCWETVETEDATLAVETDRTIRAERSRLRQVFENLFRNAVEHGSTSPPSQAPEDAVEHGSTSPRSNPPEDAVEHGSTSPPSQAPEDAVEHGSPDGRAGEASDGSDDGHDDDSAETVTIRVGELPEESGFFVADDGVGIPEDERGRVFEPGYSTRQEGTGFGLNIVTGVVEAHGWSVRVTESAEGGARFEFAGVEPVE